MATYIESLSPVSQLIHGRLASWLGRDVAFLNEDGDDAVFLAPLNNGVNVGITYNKQTETYTLYRFTDELEPLNLIVIRIGAFMVAELFTRRRLVAALDVLK